MTIWTVTTTTSYSALPFVNGDSFGINSPGDLDADQNGKAGADCNVNDGGIFRVSPNVSALFNNGAAYELFINEGGLCYGEGTSGNNAILGGDSGQDADRIKVGSGGFFQAVYTTIQYMSNINSLLIDASRAILKNVTISHLGTYPIGFNAGGSGYLENVTWGDSDSTGSLRSANTSGTIVLKNCTMKASSAWFLGAFTTTIYIIGNTTIDVGGGAVEPTNANDSGTFVEDYRYYPKLTLDEGNNLEDCIPSLNHVSQPEAGWVFEESTTKMLYEPYLAFEKTDGSGNVDLYMLQKTYFDGTWKYWSDSGEAESGDNQKFTIGLVKASYDLNTTTKWADDGTASITLAAAGGGGGGCKLAGAGGGMVG